MAIGPELKHQIDESIKNAPVFVAAKSSNPDSQAAIQLIEQYGVEVSSVDIDTVAHGREIEEYLQTKTGQDTVPFIFAKGRFIGGAENLKLLIQNGELKNLLQTA